MKVTWMARITNMPQGRIEYALDLSDYATNVAADTLALNALQYQQRNLAANLTQTVCHVQLQTTMPTVDHLQMGVPQYYLRVNNQLSRFEVTPHEPIWLIRENGKFSQDALTESNEKLHFGNSALLYYLNKDEVERLYDAGLYDDPGQTMRHLNEALYGRTFELGGHIMLTSMTLPDQDFKLGAQPSTEKYQLYGARPVSEIPHVDAERCPMLAVVLKEAMLDATREFNQQRDQQLHSQLAVHEWEHDLQNQDQLMHQQIQLNHPLSLEQQLDQVTPEAESSWNDQAMPQTPIKVDREVYLNDLTQLSQNMYQKDDSRDVHSTFEHTGNVGNATNSYHDRLQKAEQKLQTKKASASQTAPQVSMSDHLKQQNEDVTKRANRVLQTKIAEEVADDVTSSLTDHGEEDRKRSQFESMDEQKKREANQAKYHTTNYEETKVIGHNDPQRQIQRQQDAQLTAKAKGKKLSNADDELEF